MTVKTHERWYRPDGHHGRLTGWGSESAQLVKLGCREEAQLPGELRIGQLQNLGKAIGVGRLGRRGYYLGQQRLQRLGPRRCGDRARNQLARRRLTLFPYFGQVCGGVLPHLVSWRTCGRHHPITDASARSKRLSRPWLNASLTLCIP